MTIVSANWADLLDVPVRFRFDQAFNRRPSLIDRMFNVQGSTTAYEEVSGVGAIGIEAWETFEASGKVGSADFDQGYKKTYTHREYPLEINIRRKLLDDGNLAEAFRIVERVGDSARVKREVDAASVFNNAFSDTYAGADAVGLCSTAHPLSPQNTGTTQSNEFTYALTKPNLKLVREAMMAWTDDKGSKMAVTPDTILVPPALEDTALEITQSILDPSSANNTINPQFGRFQVVTWHYLTDSNAWFVIDSNLMRQALEWYNRVPLGVTPKVEDKTISATWIAYMRYSYGFADWRWVAGSNPS
jgi:phage major head subunit gpT-like protein